MIQNQMVPAQIPKFNTKNRQIKTNSNNHLIGYKSINEDETEIFIRVLHYY